MSLTKNAKENTTMAIQIIEKKNGELILNEDGLNALKEINENLAICVCVGPYRQGKSFLLNQILKKDNGFEIGHKDNACTHGIWMYKYPAKIKDSKGNKLAVILMDTEVLIFNLMGSFKAYFKLYLNLGLRIR